MTRDTQPQAIEDPRRSDADDGAGFADLWRPEASCEGPRGPEAVLLQEGTVTPEQVADARALRETDPSLSVLQALVQGGAVGTAAALEAEATYCGLPFQRLASAEIESSAFELLPLEYTKQKGICPIRYEDDAILVAISEPANIFAIDDMKRRIRKKVRLVVVPPGDIAQAVEELSAQPEQQVDEIIKDIAEDAVEVVEDDDEEVTDLEKIAGESPVIRYVNFLIASAVREGASDIHVEPGEKRLRVRCRIDGMLFDQQAPPLHMHAAIVSRLKIMANMDIAERRMPQDGRIRATVHGRTVDLRVSTLPTIHGEKCVIRILDNRSITVGLENLGMWDDTLRKFRQQILEPHGIVLVTGPTGSGKSTTLYSSLQIMDGDRLNVSTVEDPVEYELAFANQVNVQEGIGFSFASALRSLLRQDPDVIMVGEIRDPETARIAVQASLTGHLVLSTLHTNDAPSSITRMVNIGIEPYLISAAVNAVLAQRLVRKICENCREPVREPEPTVRAYLERCGVGSGELYAGVGCERCRQTGYKGRLGIYELMILDDEVRDMVTRNGPLSELRRVVREKGMRSLRDDGLQKIGAGLTTAEEIMRVTEV